jgi:DUF4097 and DUF4098 domain-containing protein YvlB
MTRLSAIALILVAAGSVQAAEKSLDRTFAVSPGGSLSVDADSASVRVSANDSNQVIVRMRARDSDENLANTRLEAVQTGDGVTVTLRQGNRSSGWFNWRSWNGDQEIDVTVPRRYNVRVRTGGGSIELRDVTGTANLGTSGGDINVRNLGGNIELRTSGGGIHADTVRGDVNADTSGGDVRLMNIDGKIRGNTSGGSVRCSLVGANRGISATTSGGDIELILPRTVAGELKATTSGGDIESDIPVPVTSTKEDRLIGPLNGGGQLIEARTSGGSIRVRASG